MKLTNEPQRPLRSMDRPSVSGKGDARLEVAIGTVLTVIAAAFLWWLL